MTVYSQNGWIANDQSRTRIWTIPGTTRTIRLEAWDAGYLLTRFAAWFHRNIESINGGQYDDWGYAERPIRGSLTELSNHASGTAIDLNSLKHPLGAVNTFSPTQVSRIQNELSTYAGAIRWGGNYKNRKDEMHFEINVDKDTVHSVAQFFRMLDNPPTRKEAPMNFIPLTIVSPDGLSFRATCPIEATATSAVLNRAWVRWFTAWGTITEGRIVAWGLGLNGKFGPLAESPLIDRDWWELPAVARGFTIEGKRSTTATMPSFALLTKEK